MRSGSQIERRVGHAGIVTGAARAVQVSQARRSSEQQTCGARPDSEHAFQEGYPAENEAAGQIGDDNSQCCCAQELQWFGGGEVPQGESHSDQQWSMKKIDGEAIVAEPSGNGPLSVELLAEQDE